MCSLPVECAAGGKKFNDRKMQDERFQLLLIYIWKCCAYAFFFISINLLCHKVMKIINIILLFIASEKIIMW